MYEAVYAYPDGQSTAARFADTAARYGYEGVVVRAREATPDYATLRDAGYDVVDGVEVVADTPDQASGGIGNYRPKTTLLLLRGGTNALNRFAVEQERVDVLTRPMADDGDFNHVLARAANENGVRVEFDLGPVLRLDGGHRVRAIRNLRKLRELVEQYDAPYVVSATPQSHLQLRAPRELVAVGETIGFSEDQIREGLAEWGRLAERNRRLTSESFIAPGVERGRYEEDD
ncbi:ribonuclease P/MRP protein subunit RPP1 [Halogranum amylolyticum]|uniref:Ribonuclease P protein component 3 n=1 Tax=Halogranum amylolyticum TaxID=660520 RepID=A0A1H8P3D5_9EURY|nr:RNase P subunit p30 family protein [Halogranum amylolyticum]SEO36466.1 ribonuclease P/MRP protein subunit RPP1 [Halogranum amylolyticum]